MQDVKEIILKKIARIEECKKFYGNIYNHQYDGYLFAHDNGNLVSPNYFTKRFHKLVKRYQLRLITPHGLRHSITTLLHLGGLTLEIYKIG